ncbi:hypothetical protein A0H81_13188 [Grifola frondosa]|uniref:Acetyl-coenzyme A carboxylase carboxyl transferase subunit beta domain-containing protein n=1 Tax=Grifola frondosa TaxID=5627 RepID=A0A1C7LQ02_GRIFR|nr:hypothetical protein A0H81_13188 [Grifola frondosa]
MEMFADVDARAGVLEPEGIVEIKMRRDKILKLMERLDSKYAALKKDSTDTSKSAEARAEAADELAKRETLLQQTYRQIALLYADLHDRTGRMEAKGCAKAVVWKNARRSFYWAVRAKVARSAALAKLAVASPESSFEYRSRLLDSLASIEPTTDLRIVAEKVESLDLTATLAQLKADHLMRQMLALAHEDRKATLDGLVRLVDNLADDEKQAFVNALQASTRSPGPPSYANASA